MFTILYYSSRFVLIFTKTSLDNYALKNHKVTSAEYIARKLLLKSGSSIYTKLQLNNEASDTLR